MNDDSEEQPRSRWRRSAIVAATVLVVVGAGYGAFRFIAGLSSGPQKHTMEVVTLKLIQPPPPPPPPPPPVPKPPEPAKMLEQPKDLKPPDKPKVAEKPPEQLAVDAKGEHGPGDILGKPGGESLIGGGGGGTGTGSRFGWYANLMQESIERTLQKDDKLRTGHYAIVVAMSLSPTGQPDHVKLIKSTGDRETDARIEQVLSSMPRLPEAPPSDMPQPVNLQIDARATQ